MSEPKYLVSDSALEEVTSPSPVDTKASPTPTVSCHEFDVEKAESFEDDSQSLARYVVPTLAKGVKTALSKPPNVFTRFRVWYNPYRMVRTRMPLLIHDG